jgi:hypothetical protein
MGVRQQWLSSRAQMQKLIPLLASTLMQLVQLQHTERVESERRLAEKHDKASDEAGRVVAEVQRKGREALELALAEAERLKEVELQRALAAAAAERDRQQAERRESDSLLRAMYDERIDALEATNRKLHSQIAQEKADFEQRLLEQEASAQSDRAAHDAQVRAPRCDRTSRLHTMMLAVQLQEMQAHDRAARAAREKEMQERVARLDAEKEATLAAIRATAEAELASVKGQLARLQKEKDEVEQGMLQSQKQSETVKMLMKGKEQALAEMASTMEHEHRLLKSKHKAFSLRMRLGICRHTV